ncbi:MAG TPA: hypothetical protein VGL66_15155 [Caulobacteraceae bacterium]|jgi:Holliday junction resolvasome RuvABC endonuclease subunit
MTASRPPGLVLGFHPTPRGFGWVAFDGIHLIDWGLVFVTGDKNPQCIRRLDAILQRLTPEALVMEAFSRTATRRAERIARLNVAVTNLAESRGVEVFVYTRDEVREAFSEVGARTRQEIAEAVVRHVAALRHRLPYPRRIWQSEDRRQALFVAAALVLTHLRDGL